MNIFFIFLILFSFQAFAEDNIISVTTGVQTNEENITTSTVNSSYVTTTTEKENEHHEKKTTSTSSNFSPSANSSPISQNKTVLGLQYQRKIGNLWLGVLIQNNQTYSLSYGIGF